MQYALSEETVYTERKGEGERELGGTTRTEGKGERETERGVEATFIWHELTSMHYHPHILFRGIAVRAWRACCAYPKPALFRAVRASASHVTPKYVARAGTGLSGDTVRNMCTNTR